MIFVLEEEITVRDSDRKNGRCQNCNSVLCSQLLAYLSVVDFLCLPLLLLICRWFVKDDSTIKES